MVVIHVGVPPGAYSAVEEAVFCHELEHVVEERQRGAYVTVTFAVEAEGEFYLRFPGDPVYCRASTFHVLFLSEFHDAERRLRIVDFEADEGKF